MRSRSQFVLGLIAGEGSFCIGFTKDERARFGVSARHVFSFEMNDPQGVQMVKDAVTVDSDQGCRVYVRRQSNVQELIDWVEDHRGPSFDATAKADSFDVWADTFDRKRELMSSRDGMVELIERGVAINPDTRGHTADELLAVVEE